MPANHDGVAVQIHPRRRRGGETIPGAQCLQELDAVFDGALVVDGVRGHRVNAHCALAPSEIARLGARLGYTRAIVKSTPVNAEGDDVNIVARLAKGSRRRGFAEGLHREDGRLLQLEPLFVADEHAHDTEDHSADAGRNPPVHRRRLSMFDARFVANMCGVLDGARVLDPFAGPGVLLSALQARGVVTVGVDVVRFDVAPDAREPRPMRVHADARSLPFADGAFSGVVTEPPYRVQERDVVCASIAELARVVDSDGILVFLSAASLTPFIIGACKSADRDVDIVTTMRRHGLVCELLVARR